MERKIKVKKTELEVKSLSVRSRPHLAGWLAVRYFLGES